MVYTYSLAYRFKGKEQSFVEGFVGRAVTKRATARENAIRKVKLKANALGETFEQGRLIESDDGLSFEEIETIRRDWRTSAQSKTT